MADELKLPWSSCLPRVLYNYNHEVHSTTKYTPMEVFFGRTDTALDLTKSGKELIELQKVIHQAVRENSSKVAKRMVQRHIKKAKVLRLNEEMLSLSRNQKEKTRTNPCINTRGKL